MSQLSTRTRRLSRWLEWACYAAMALMLVFALYALFTPGFLEEEAALQLLRAPMTWPIGPAARLMLMSVGAMALFAVLFTLWHTARLFRLFGTGEVISPDTARTIRRIGIGLLAQAGLGVLGPMLAGLILSIDAPEGQGMLVIQITSSDIGFALAGGLMMLIGLVMVQAVEVMRENREFV